MNERLEILQLIEAGRISVAEGVRRLEALGPAPEGGGTDSESEVGVEALSASGVRERADVPRRPALVSYVWRAVFAIGVALLATGGWLLAWGYAEESSGLAWGWVTFVAGLLLMGLGWWLVGAHWFYLRVRERDGSRFTLALPLPLGMVGWLVRVARPFVPQLREIEAETLILAVERELREGRPCVVRVDEGSDGDQVEMIFG